jgi:predicted nucleic-acid-binding Zn-ribbon protein
MGLFGKDKPETVTVNLKPFTCQVCSNALFWQREASLHTGIASFFNLEWTAPTCTCLVCSNCGYVHWFLPQS